MPLIGPFHGRLADARARKHMGDGKKPNYYLVTCDSTFWALDETSPGYKFWTDPAEVDPIFKKFIVEFHDSWGPYDNYLDARAKFWEIYPCMEEIPTIRNAPHSVFIEDRLSGQIAAGGLYAEKGPWGWKFHSRYHEELSYTMEKMGFDITKFKTRKEAVASNE